MEFLMTYGWAVLVVLIVIGALAYFGVLNPQKLLPEKCTLMVGLYCLDHRISTAGAGADAVFLRMENGMGKDVKIINLTFKENSASPLLTCSVQSANGVINISNGQSQVVNFSTGGLAACTPAAGLLVGGSKYKIDIEFVYRYTDSTFDHTGHGELFATAEN